MAATILQDWSLTIKNSLMPYPEHSECNDNNFIPFVQWGWLVGFYGISTIYVI